MKKVSLCYIVIITTLCATAQNTETTYEDVDLGLPSGTRWATFNIGATSQEEFGDYFAWGETEPKTIYWWDTYKYGYNYDKLTKYCYDSNYGKNDNLIELEASDDAATINWGEPWRMPTEDEWEELLKYCACTWDQDKNGYTLKSKINSNTIFLPAAGYRSGDDLRCAGYYGFYWSSSLYTDHPYIAWNTTFNLNLKVISNSGSRRLCGFSIRPVYKK